jgi:hypothetical protein
MNDTPETEAAVIASGGDWSPVLRETCRRLERQRDEYYNKAMTNAGLILDARAERDEAREHLREIKEYGTDEINAAVELRQKLAQALVDLDNMQDQRDLAMKVITRLKQERDEVREVFWEMWQSGDAFLPHVDEETTNRWRKAAGWEETK